MVEKKSEQETKKQRPSSLGEVQVSSNQSMDAL